MLLPIKDKLGRSIEAGSFLAYGQTLGRCAGIRIGKVVDIYERTEGYSSKKGTIIKVWGVDDDWKSREPALCQTAGHLQFPERMVVLDRAAVPESYLLLLDPVDNSYKRQKGN